MDDEDKQCICCGKEVSVLIQVTRTDEKGDLFLRNRGVCRNCLINGDVEKVTKEFEIKKCQAEHPLTFMEDMQMKAVKKEKLLTLQQVQNWHNDFIKKLKDKLIASGITEQNHLIWRELEEEG